MNGFQVEGDRRGEGGREQEAGSTAEQFGLQEGGGEYLLCSKTAGVQGTMAEAIWSRRQSPATLGSSGAGD